jgi:hypothetical protein
MKSQGEVLLRTIAALMKDAQLACGYPDVELSRDLDSLTLGYKNRGLAYFTLDLPSLDALLLSSLEDRRLKPTGPLSRCRSRKDCRPRFLHGLWSLIFDHSGCLIEKDDIQGVGDVPTAIFFLRSICCYGKKLEVPCSPNRIKNAIKEYHEIEDRITDPILNWESDSLNLSDLSKLDYSRSFAPSQSVDLFGVQRRGTDREVSSLLATLDYVSRVLVSELGYFDPMSGNESEFGRFKHGPGAVADAKQTHFKYVFPHWPEKLEGVFPFDWCGSSSLQPDYIPSTHEPPSRLIAVPKTAKAPRLIASEPIAHQWCQQKIASWLDRRFQAGLIGRFVDLHEQRSSQVLVASASRTGDLATLDLSSASDRLSCRHVESLCRSNSSLLEAIHSVRTRWVRDSISDLPGFRKLRKFSAMGSALTFPIQSVFFLCCCLAACQVTSRRDIQSLVGKVRVFGDDLIVPVDSRERLELLLGHLGLKVNLSKSFSKGKFRESCGADCYNGVDVTPVKPKHALPGDPSSVQALVDTVNNLFRKGCWYASEELRSTQLGGFSLPVVRPDAGLSGYESYSLALGRLPRADLFETREAAHRFGEVGLRCYTLSDRGGRTILRDLTRRWNVSLHRHEFRVDSFRVRQRIATPESSACLLQFFTEVPNRDTSPLTHVKWTAGRALRPTDKFRPVWVAQDQLISVTHDLAVAG